MSNRNLEVSLTVRREVESGGTGWQGVRAGVLSKEVDILEEAPLKAGLRELIETNPLFKGWKMNFPVITYPARLPRIKQDAAMKALRDWIDGFKYPSSSS